MKMRTIGIAAALALGAVLGTAPVDVDAQSLRIGRGEAATQAERGWIGISFDVMTDRRGRIGEIVITDVSAGSPAQEAGVLPGDRILGINDLDDPRELADLGARLQLAPGDDVVAEAQLKFMLVDDEQ